MCTPPGLLYEKAGKVLFRGSKRQPLPRDTMLKPYIYLSRTGVGDVGPIVLHIMCYSWIRAMWRSPTTWPDEYTQRPSPKIKYGETPVLAHWLRKECAAYVSFVECRIPNNMAQGTRAFSTIDLSGYARTSLHGSMFPSHGIKYIYCPHYLLSSNPSSTKLNSHAARRTTTTNMKSIFLTFSLIVFFSFISATPLSGHDSFPSLPESRNFAADMIASPAPGEGRSLEKREAGGVYLCTDANWSGTCGYAQQQVDACIGLTSP